MRSERYPGESTHYNDIICHENLRVAVCGMLENECSLNIPSAFNKILRDNFFAFYDQYENACKKRLHLDKQTMWVRYFFI